MILPLPRMTTYSGAKPCSTSTPIFDLGRSMTWPTEAFTVKPGPRYFLMVFALAGDSTTTRAFSFFFLAAAAFAMTFLSQAHEPPTGGACGQTVQLQLHHQRRAGRVPQPGANRQIADVTRRRVDRLGQPARLGCLGQERRRGGPSLQDRADVLRRDGGRGALRGQQQIGARRARH